MEIDSVPDQVLVHMKDGKRVAVTFFNGHEDRYALDEPMTRQESEEFYEANRAQIHDPLN